MKKRPPRTIDRAAIFGSCDKKRYPHERAARQAMETQMQYAHDRGEDVHLRVYRCERSYCGGWHLTSR